MLTSDSSSSSLSPCTRAEALRDYAFDELPVEERLVMEQHLAGCADCALELDRLHLTTAALRTLPDREIPQRIAFVSDRVFEPSAFRRFWNSGARLGFASACMLSLALIVSAWHYRPADVHTASVSPTQASSQGQVAQDQISAAVTRAVAQVRAEDARMIEAAVQSAERKRDAEYRSQMVAIAENFDRLRKRLTLSYASLASNDLTGSGAGQ